MLNTDQLVDFWHKRVERDQRDYISYTELGGAFIRRARETGDVDSYTRAEAALHNALGVNPNYSSTLSYLASVQFVQHDFRGALQLAERVYAADPGAAHALAVIGDVNLELGEYEKAEAAYNRLLALSRTSPVYSRLAHLAELNGQAHTAIELMRRAIGELDAAATSPESRAWYHVQLGHLYFNTGDLDSAQDEYERSLEALPGYVHAVAGLAKVHAGQRDYDAAIALYSQVVTRYPIPEYVIALGDVYRVAGRPDEARKQYDLVGAIDRLYKANGINTDLQMALYFADHDLRLDEALRQARAEYERRPSVQAADALAWTLYKSGRYEEARRYSQKALRLGTQDPLMLYRAGTIARAAGQTEQARQYLARALDLNPRFSVLYADEAERALRELDDGALAAAGD